ncbi:MAG: hypothetical protein GC160_19210 [Acidobacteria bacterium]|nr:hypothetical protein [Acidobacteriota bacterium]
MRPLCYFLLLGLAVAFPAAAQQRLFTEQDGLLSIEAENFASRGVSTFNQFQQIHTWELMLEFPEPINTGASGTGWMEALPDERGENGVGPGVPEETQGARLDYKIWINTPGVYYIWVRGRSKGSESNGLHVGLDGVLGGGQAISGFYPQNHWSWENARRSGTRAMIDIRVPGPYTLNVWERDDGFKLDKIVLWQDPDVIPSGTGPDESATNQGTLVISPASLPDGMEREPYEQAFTSPNASGPLSWTVEGSLPQGLSLDASTGVLSGTPVQRGQYAFVVKVADSRGERGGRNYQLQIVGAPLQILSTSPAPPATLGQPYSFQIEVIGGEPPYIWFQLRSYPPGLSLDSSTGVVSGVPIQPGRFTFAVLVNDSKKGFTDRTFDLVVVGEPLTITTPGRLPAAAVGEPYSVQLTAAGGAEPYAWSAVSELPEGFALSPAGLLTGTATTAAEAAIRLAVSDAGAGRAEQDFVLPIRAPFVSVTAAGFGEGPVAPDSIVSGFGVELAPAVAQATEQPLPTVLLGRRVDVIDSAGTRRPASLFFVSPQQINYLLPPFMETGPATIEVLDEDGLAVSSGSVTIQRVAPSLFESTADGVAAGYAIRVTADGEQVVEQLVQALPDGSLTALPLAPLGEGEQRYLVVFGTGLRAWVAEPTATLGGVEVPVLAAQAQGEFAGLDQVNLGPLPAMDAGPATLLLRFPEGDAQPVTVHFGAQPQP